MQEPNRNPYQAPGSNLVEPTKGDLGALGEISSRPAGAGWEWFSQGFGIFKANAGLWIGMSVVYIVLMMVISFIPLVSIAASVLAPVFSGGFMIACRNSERGMMSFGDLFAGFQQRGGPLVILGLIILGFYLLLGLVLVAVGGGAALLSGGIEPGQEPTVALEAAGAGLLVVMLLAIPLVMAQWFAPALVALHGMAPWTAFKTSFSACMKNLLAFLVYGVIVFVAAVLATIPFGLGWLVLMPVLIGSVYCSYKDVFQVR